MGIYDWACRGAKTALCVGGLAAGLFAVSPSIASATCKTDVTASGSTLQTSQQKKWNEAWAGSGCAAGTEILYNNGALGGTGSGQGLEEFGMPSKELLPALSSNETELDGFVGTDDPPTGTLLEEGKTASESQVLTIPVVSAPIALIFHPPTACTFKLASWHLTNKIAGEIWSGDFTWKQVLEKLSATEISSGCEAAMLKEVRFDSSGTSFAFKWWLCQVESGAEVEKASETTCSTWKAFLTDAAEWPTLVEAKTTHLKAGVETKNKGTGEEINAVSEEAGSIGYANFANVETEGGFKAYAEKGTKFWAALETKSSSFTEPGPTGKEGNCPTTLTEKQEKAVEKAATSLNWEGVHISFVKGGELYPLCTLTYDVTWQNFLTAKLKGEKAYLSEGKAEETANTVKTYLEWVTKEKEKGGANILNGYHTAPKLVLEKAKKAIEKIEV